MLTVFFFLILGTVSLATNNPIFTLISFIPISLIPIDFVVTAISFIVVRLNRVYKNLLSDMKKEYGIKNDKDLVEVYRKEKGVTKEVKKVNTKNSVKNTVVSSEKSDSLFLERMLGYVSNSKYVPVENREKFLDEINFILNKYSMLKSEYPGKRVEQYLASDIEHLHGEYTRYLENNNNNYSRKLK